MMSKLSWTRMEKELNPIVSPLLLLFLSFSLFPVTTSSEKKWAREACRPFLPSCSPPFHHFFCLSSLWWDREERHSRQDFAIWYIMQSHAKGRDLKSYIATTFSLRKQIFVNDSFLYMILSSALPTRQRKPCKTCHKVNSKTQNQYTQDTRHTVNSPFSENEQKRGRKKRKQITHHICHRKVQPLLESSIKLPRQFPSNIPTRGVRTKKMKGKRERHHQNVFVLISDNYVLRFTSSPVAKLNKMKHSLTFGKRERGREVHSGNLFLEISWKFSNLNSFLMESIWERKWKQDSVKKVCLSRSCFMRFEHRETNFWTRQNRMFMFH